MPVGDTLDCLAHIWSCQIGCMEIPPTLTTSFRIQLTTGQCRMRSSKRHDRVHLPLRSSVMPSGLFHVDLGGHTTRNLHQVVNATHTMMFSWFGISSLFIIFLLRPYTYHRFTASLLGECNVPLHRLEIAMSRDAHQHFGSHPSFEGYRHEGTASNV